MAVDTFRVFLLATLLGVVLSVAVHDTNQVNPLQKRCSTKCPPFPTKMFSGFAIGKSYRFTYIVNSAVIFDEVGVSATSDSELVTEAEVLMSFYDPCDVSIQIKNPRLNDKENKKMIDLLTKYPLMAGVSKGIITDVCAHPDDEPVSLNMKKGILSTLQNSMPVLPIKINATITETDVLGLCPTVYKSHSRNNVFTVEKFKDHKYCTGQHTADDESPVTSLFLKSSLSLMPRAASDCYQKYDLTKNIFKSASCVDVKVILLAHNKKIDVLQSSNITLIISTNDLIVPKLDKIRRTDLIFEVLPGPTSDVLVPLVKKQLKQLCEETQDVVKENAAIIYEELIKNLKRVSRNEIKQLLLDIKAGKFCQKYERLENLYLDALPYLNNAGAVEVMVDQVLSGKVIGGRTFLYTIALHLIKKPCIYCVKAVSPLFESKSAPSPMVLAAGSLVKKYCKFNKHCLQEKAVQDIFQKIANRIDSTCPSSKNNNDKRFETLTLLKSVGNIGRISKSLEDSILKCLSSEEADTFVRISAAQAFRQSSCESKPNEKFLDLALNPNEDMEVRIASYLVAVTCANNEQVSLLLSKMENEPNKQVSSFILSHLRSIQKSEAPYLRRLHYNMTAFSIPFVYSKDILRLSRHVDTSYYLPTFGVGAGVETCILYSPDSQILRQIGTNYTLELPDNIFNTGEFSFRIQNLETLLIKMVMRIFKQQKRTDISVSDVLKALHMSPNSKLELPKLDYFFRLFSQEVAFLSVASLSEKDWDAEEIVEKIMKIFDKLFLYFENMNPSSARGGQIRLNQFISTSQGIPVQLKAVFISVLTIDSNKVDRISPAASYYANIFVGYNIGAKSGFRIKIKGYVTPHTLSDLKFSKENMKIVLDIPKEIELIGIHYNCTMINKLPGGKDIELYPQIGYPTHSEDKCYGPEKIHLNIDLCTHLKSPDYKKVKIFPFGAIDLKITARKPQADKKVLEIDMNAKYEKIEKSFDLKARAPGTKNPNLMDFSMLYKSTLNLKSHTFLVYARGPNKKGNAVLVNMNSKMYSSGNLHNIFVYHSDKKEVASTDQVISMKMKNSQKGKSRNEFHLSTKNKLKKYVDATIIVDFSSDSSPRVSKSKLEINKLEFNLTIPQKFNTTHYIRKTSKSSGDRIAYDFYSSSNTPSRELLKISGNYSSEGHYSKMTRVSQAAISLKFLESELFFKSQHSYTSKKKRIHYSLKNPKEKKTLFFTEASLVRMPTSDSSYNLNAQVQIPKLMPTYIVSGEFEKKSPKQMYILMDLKENGKVLFKTKGTVSADISPSQIKQRTELKIINVLYSQEYDVKYKIFFVEGTKDVWVTLSSNGSPFFSAEVELVTENDLLSTTIGVTVPKIIDAKLKAEKTRTLMHMAMNSFIHPNTDHSRKIKASSYLNLIDKEMKGRLDYDLEKDPKKKIEFMTHYDYNYERKYASVKGEIDVLDDKYQIAAETILGAYTRDPDNKNLLHFKVIMPNGENFVLHTECLHIKNTPYRSTIHSILVETASGERHELKSHYKYDFSKAPVRMMIAGKTEIDCPIVKKVVIVVDTAVDINRDLQKGHFKMDVESVKISAPIKTNFEFINQEKELKANALLDLGTSSHFKINGETQLTRNNEKRVKDGFVHLTVDLSDSKNYNMKVQKDPKSLLFNLSFNDKVIVVLEQENPENGVCIVKLTTPLRRTEAHSTLSSDAVILTLYPNRIRSEDKYEAEGHFRHKESSLETGARLSYPRRENDMRLQMNIEKKDHLSAQGRVEVDIFETPQDKIVINVRTQKSKMDNNLKLEADIKIPNQETVPRLDVDVALSEMDKHLEIYLRKSASVEPSISYVMRINRPTFKTSVVYSRLSTSKENIEMISELKHHELLQCMGNTLNGTVSSEKHGSFHFKSAVCMPGYIEFGTKKLSEDKIYMAKVGMKRPDAAKVALDLIFDSPDAITVDNFWKMESTFNMYGEHKYLVKRPVVLVGVKLWRSRFVTVDAIYSSKGVKDYYKTVIKPAYNGMQKLTRDLCEELPKEMQENIFVKLPKVAAELVQEVRNLREKLSQELSVVMKELGMTLPNLKEIQERIKASLQKMADVYQEFIEKVDELLHHFGIHTGIEKVMKMFHDFDAMIQKAMVAAAKAIRKMIDDMLDGKLEELPGGKWLTEKLGNSFLDWIKEKWNNIKNAFMNKFNEIKKFIHHYAHAIENAIKNMYTKIMNFPLIKKFTKWIESWFNMEDWWDFHTLFPSSFSNYFFRVTAKEGVLRFQLPVKKPAYSLAVAMRNIGLSMPKQQLGKDPHK